mgnify:CR=1 FL=1
MKGMHAGLSIMLVACLVLGGSQAAGTKLLTIKAGLGSTIDSVIAGSTYEFDAGGLARMQDEALVTATADSIALEYADSGGSVSLPPGRVVMINLTAGRVREINAAIGDGYPGARAALDEARHLHARLTSLTTVQSRLESITAEEVERYAAGVPSYELPVGRYRSTSAEWCLTVRRLDSAGSDRAAVFILSMRISSEKLDDQLHDEIYAQRSSHGDMWAPLPLSFWRHRNGRD